MQKLGLSLVVILLSANALASNLICGSKNQGIRYFALSLSETGAVLSLGKTACHMVPIPYKPRSGKYQGWVRVASNDNGCLAFGKAVAGSMATFLSLDPNVAKGQEGFAQLGYANTSDPGAGSELKADLRCFVKN